jgi:hypothetical protein
MSSFPMTERCFLMLAILGGEASTTQVRKGLEREAGEDATTEQVGKALRYLATRRPPRVEVARAGARSMPTIWRLTAYGNEALAEGDDGTIPCGTGWPASADWPQRPRGEKSPGPTPAPAGGGTGRALPAGAGIAKDHGEDGGVLHPLRQHGFKVTRG